MLKRQDLEKLKTVTGFNLWQTEKDYLQHLFLQFLSRHAKTELVFKGGTALQKAYGLDRFSIDLDFTLNGKLDAAKLVDKITADLTVFGFSSHSKHMKKRTGETFILKTEGPLYDGREKTLSTLRIETSSRENVVMQPLWKEIVPVYEDLRPYIAYVMRTEEILAEKVRAVMTRTKARDVYDIWFLLKRGVEFSEPLARQKLEFYGKEWNPKDFADKLGLRESVWKSEMEPVLTRLPDFREVRKLILERIGVK